MNPLHEQRKTAAYMSHRSQNFLFVSVVEFIRYTFLFLFADASRGRAELR